MLRIDLADAAIPYRDAAGPVFGFRAPRRQSTTLAGAAGASPRVVRRLMRHSTWDLLTDPYSPGLRIKLVIFGRLGRLAVAHRGGNPAASTKASHTRAR